jgi:hypothetical protein
MIWLRTRRVKRPGGQSRGPDPPMGIGASETSRGSTGYFDRELSLLDGAPADDVSLMDDESRMDDVSDVDELFFMEDVSVLAVVSAPVAPG